MNDILLTTLFGIPLAILIVSLFLFRRVVETNEVHIVQYKKKTVSYGKDTLYGNVYYEWPHQIPLFGITKVTLPTSVFDLSLDNYEAYDKGRLPFIVDVKAFFRVVDSDMAAQRVASFSHLNDQLRSIVQGAVRTILASSEIEEIMQGRSKFGQDFTKEVEEQLSNWGVGTVKNIELMDIRDSHGSNVIKNIMDKKKSHIEMESRQEVAKNMREAKIAEVNSVKDIEFQQQIAKETVGLRQVEAERNIALAKETQEQMVKEQAKITTEKQMEVLRIELIKKAEIEKQMTIIKAQQQKESTILVAEGNLEQKRKESEAVKIEGDARANAEKLMQLAPIEAQISLAKEIGTNDGYQKYLISLRQIEANQAVGIEQATALEKSDIKIIVNSDSPNSGLNKTMDLFTSKGGMQIGAMLEGFTQTDTGKKVLSKLDKKDSSLQ